MAQFGLYRALRDLHRVFDEHRGTAAVPNEFVTPGFWVLLAVRAQQLGIGSESIAFSHPDHPGYADAMGLPVVLGEDDSYELRRSRSGQNYAPLVKLASQEATDAATARINDCIRNLAYWPEVAQEFLHSLFDIVGDLHDNVWAHGRSVGVSMAQRWKVPYHNDHYLEFALADGGIGFLREVKRVGLQITTDRDAIDWCVVEGNSTKALTEPDDFWAQSVPDDIIGNPMIDVTKKAPGPNHHQGIGLSKLLKFVTNFEGSLNIASGRSLLRVEGQHTFRYHEIPNHWQGVAISCRFRESHFKRPNSDTQDPEVDALMGRLRGGRT